MKASWRMILCLSVLLLHQQQQQVISSSRYCVTTRARTSKSIASFTYHNTKYSSFTVAQQQQQQQQQQRHRQQQQYLYLNNNNNYHHHQNSAQTTKSSNRLVKLQQRRRSMSSTTTTTSSTSLSASSAKQIVVDSFCFRQFKEHTNVSANYGGTVFDITVEQLETIVNERYNNGNEDETQLQDGYAPFCKHLFIRNDFIPTASVNVLRITAENEHLLRTRYEARNDKELPVLVRYFPKQLLVDANVLQQLPTAQYLDLILYSREQIQKETIAQMQQQKDTNITTTSSSSSTDTIPAPWGIVSIKAQDLPTEIPMNPITAMRNALGCEEGGSGVPLDRTKYMEAVDYWKDHAIIS